MKQVRIKFHRVHIKSLDLDLQIKGKSLYIIVNKRGGTKDKNLVLDEPHIFDENTIWLLVWRSRIHSRFFFSCPQRNNNIGSFFF